MAMLAVKDGAEPFDVTVLEAAAPVRVVAFSVGAGGNPERHLPLMAALVEQGCTVVAPHFERLVSPVPTDEHLQLRARRLQLAVDSVARAGLPVAGVGHSIGTTVLLALAGGKIWMRHGDPPLAIATDARLDRLALLAPATGFFQGPGALDTMHLPLSVWAGTDDAITPPPQASFLKSALGERVPVELHIIEGAGHFSFLHVPPPQTTEPLADRGAFLDALTRDVCEFVTRRP